MTFHFGGHRTRIILVGTLVAAVAIGIPVAVVVSRHSSSSPQAKTPSSPTSHPSTPTVSSSPTPGCAATPGGSPSTTLDADHPTALAFAPDGRLFYTERSGTIRVVEGDVASSFATVPTVTTEPDGGYSERGLLGLALSPSFGTDHFVYALYDLPDYATENVVRWTDCGGIGTAMTTLISLPAGDDCCHKGGRLAFGPDGKLYVTLGDEHVATAAQDTGDVRGKILRYNADGTIPSDNPLGTENPVWAYGFRNPFGIAFSPTGTLLVTSNGPTGDADSPSTGYDTVDIIARGTGYEWPMCYGYSHPIAPNTDCGNEQEPQWSSEEETVVPTGATYVDSAGPTAYANHFVFCNYADGMRILDLGDPHGTVTVGPKECRLDVKESPDHALYYADDDHIYRVGQGENL